MTLWRRVRKFLCSLGIDSACYHDDVELKDRQARARAVAFRLEVLLASIKRDASTQPQRGGD